MGKECPFAATCEMIEETGCQFESQLRAAEGYPHYRTRVFKYHKDKHPTNIPSQKNMIEEILSNPNLKRCPNYFQLRVEMGRKLAKYGSDLPVVKLINPDGRLPKNDS